MSVFVRLWEKVTGTPHQHQASAEVTRSARELSAAAVNLRQLLTPYTEAKDPLWALAADLHTQKELANMPQAPTQ